LLLLLLLLLLPDRTARSCCWHDDAVCLFVCLSVCLSVCQTVSVCLRVTLCIVALRVGAELYRCFPNKALPIQFFGYFCCTMYRLATKHNKQLKSLHASTAHFSLTP